MKKLFRYVGDNLTIRWLIGENDRYTVHPVGYTMLDLSIRSIRVLFPNARKVLYTAYLRDASTVQRLLAQHPDVEPVDLLAENAVRDLNPSLLRTFDRSGWWKFLHWKLAPNGFDLILDNDVILWRIPPDMASWLQSDGLMLLGRIGSLTLHKGTPYEYYRRARLGVWAEEVSKKISNTDEFFLNTGFVGLGPSVTSESLPLPINANTRFKAFTDDQGWMAINYLLWKGEKFLIDPETIVTPNNDSLPHFTNMYAGAHFTGHNNGRQNRFQRAYQHIISGEVARLESLPDQSRVFFNFGVD